MTVTAYYINDILPKDNDGHKFAGWVLENGGSDLHFLLPKGIGESTAGSKKFGSLGIGTHTASSEITATDVGVLVGGYYLLGQTASRISSSALSGRFFPAQLSEFGEMMVSGVAKSPSLLTGSVNEMSTASFLFGYQISASNPSAGGRVLIRNGSNTKLSEYFNANETTTRHRDAPVGGWYFGGSSGITVEILNIGAASVTLFLNR